MMEPTRIEDADLPNGGAYALVYWQDVEGGPVDQADAVRAEVVEYDASDRPLSITFLDLKGTLEENEADES